MKDDLRVANTSLWRSSRPIKSRGLGSVVAYSTNPVVIYMTEEEDFDTAESKARANHPQFNFEFTRITNEEEWNTLLENLRKLKEDASHA